MIVVDTTVLVYAVGDAHALRRPCRELVDLAGSGEIRAVTTVEVIQEFAHVRARWRGREDSVALARRYAVLFAPLVSPDEQDLDAGLELFAASEQLGAFEAVLAAVAERAGADALVSADAAFTAARLPVLDPAGAQFGHLLRELGS